ncbi:hypothetical protein MTR67_006825 [Solanum verrucosum]|uniref:Tf2-1-like SH3-like domain-containing protein n=1 Tax=Solanum verrucosum TaxID=315347 RepID=A0AAF0Q250_SOLVR|nr:hypothetical protein MTR67_006825 [Solanum verrucosum]
MKRCIAELVAKCPNCQQVKVEHQRPGGLGSKVNLSTAFYPQTDGQAERLIQTLKDMLRACLIDFKGNRDDHLPFIEFAYNNSYHYSTQIALYEALYGRRCRSPIGWFEIGEAGLIGPDLVHQAMEKVKIIQARISKRIGNVAYEWELPSELATFLSVFHISMLKKCMGDTSLIIPTKNNGIKDNLSYEEVPVEILDC